MTLTPRQTTKVNAALSLIAQHGHNPRTVQQHAKGLISNGTPAAQAYSTALTAFTSRVPAIRATMTIALDVIQHSDDATLGTYDRALAAYNDTGDGSHLEALAPMMLEDAKALAVRTGEATAEEVADWDLDHAFGHNEEAHNATPDVPDATAPMQAPEAPAAPTVQPATFQFSGRQAAPEPSPGHSPAGYSPVKARAAALQAGASPAGADYSARAWVGTAMPAQAE